MKDNIDKTSHTWKKIAYMWKKYFTVPSRISIAEVQKYKEWLSRLIAGKKGSKALVLGATPELRDTLTELGYFLYSIDINMDMFLAMDEILEHKDPNEVLIKANWLDNPLADNYFDVIVGDAVLPNIPWKERGHLLSEVERMLKPDGLFVTRAFCVPDEKRFATVDQVLDHFVSKNVSVTQGALEMVLELQILTYDPKDHLGSFAKAKEILSEYHKGKGMEMVNKKLQGMHDIVWNFWSEKFGDKVFIYAFRKEEEEAYSKLFNVEEVFEAKDHDYSRITPMYLLKVKP